MIRFLIAVSVTLSILVILSKVELRLPKVTPSPPSLVAPVLALAKSL